MRYGYYPGCSLERNAIAYHQSAVAVAPQLGIELNEIDDWNCCGATEYSSIDLIPAYALIARNLALAEQQQDENGGQLVAPCSACFLNLSKADHYMAEAPDLAEKVNDALSAGGLHYDPGSIQVRHLLDVIVNDVGYDAIKAKVSKPLSGLRVAPYYGCLIVRPGYQAFDDPEYPTSLDKLMRVLGAEVVDYPLKTHCCGGHMTQISRPTALELIRRLLKNAADYEADAIVTVCPMCQLNLDAFQADVNRFFGTDFHIPVLYFTQLIGVALNISPVELGFGKEFVDARPALDKIGTGSPPTGRRRRSREKGLPMPTMSEEG
ncbi:MAG: CoB--CoM heterodisulfide reductase iron-sulfur subunit B family protein [Anaerolineae bacterium]|nr:CoB--CoM heterodisulfide reductase iron-sulfur subunit B family protein [Anaerolineae bacterium]